MFVVGGSALACQPPAMDHAAQLVAEVVPRIATATAESAAFSRDGTTRVSPALRREQKSDAGAQGDSQQDAGRENSGPTGAFRITRRTLSGWPTRRQGPPWCRLH